MVRRGELWWAELPEPRASEPGYRRPVLVIQADSFNASRLRTVIAVAITSNLRLAEAPGNVLLTAQSSQLPKDSVVNVSQVVTLDQEALAELIATIPPSALAAVERGLRLAMGL